MDRDLLDVDDGSLGACRLELSGFALPAYAELLFVKLGFFTRLGAR